MGWEDLLVLAHFHPVGCEVDDWNPPFFVFAIGVAFKGEAVYSISPAYVAFVELAIDTVGNFLADL